MIHLELSTTIDRPIGQVFDFVSRPENDFQWQYGTLAAARLSDGAGGKGSAFRSIGHFMGRRIQGTFEVIDYEQNRGYGFRSLSGPMRSQTCYTFRPENGGTRISISARTHVVDFFQFNGRLVERRIKMQLKENLASLKGVLEETVPSLEPTPPSV